MSLAFLILLAGQIFAASVCIKYPTKEVSGIGPYPYNYRVIDSQIHAGGHPLDPQTRFGNSDEQVLSILAYLKKQGVKQIIDLENTQRIQSRYEVLLGKAGIKRLHIPLHTDRLPGQKDWIMIKSALQEPVYIHCKWGADRTGAIIGRYLVEEKQYSPQDAYRAVITNGSHAGYRGGLKTSPYYYNLKKFIVL